MERAHARARALPGRWGAAPAARRATWSGRAVRAPNPNDSPAGRFATTEHGDQPPVARTPPFRFRLARCHARCGLAPPLPQLACQAASGNVRASSLGGGTGRGGRRSCAPARRPGGRRNLLRPWTEWIDGRPVGRGSRRGRTRCPRREFFTRGHSCSPVLDLLQQPLSCSTHCSSLLLLLLCRLSAAGNGMCAPD